MGHSSVYHWSMAIITRKQLSNIKTKTLRSHPISSLICTQYSWQICRSHSVLWDWVEIFSHSCLVLQSQILTFGCCSSCCSNAASQSIHSCYPVSTHVKLVNCLSCQLQSRWLTCCHSITRPKIGSPKLKCIANPSCSLGVWCTRIWVVLSSYVWQLRCL